MRPPIDSRDEALLSVLEQRKPSELVPLLMEVSRRVSARRRPVDLVAQHAKDPHVALAPVDLRRLAMLDRLALEAAEAYEGVLLAPVTPLGSCAVVSPTTQDRSVTTSRTTEVVSDPTNVLALECARRWKEGRESVRLCTVHQVLRPQRFPAGRGLTQHFRLFALADAGRAVAEDGFEVEAVTRQVTTFLRLLELAADAGMVFTSPRARLLVGSRREALGERVHPALRAVCPDVELEDTPFESPYYDGLRVLIYITAKDGSELDIADVGVFDWMGKLTSNRRARFVAGGLGIQRLAYA